MRKRNSTSGERTRPRRTARLREVRDGEAPSLGLISNDSLVAGDVVTVEPGLYRPGFGGVRLEDLVLVTENGPENLTRFPYDLAP